MSTTSHDRDRLRRVWAGLPRFPDEMLLYETRSLCPPGPGPSERYLDSLGVTEEQKQAIANLGAFGGLGWDDSMHAAMVMLAMSSGATGGQHPDELMPVDTTGILDRYGLAGLGMRRATR